jgi:hypothetical protein
MGVDTGEAGRWLDGLLVTARPDGRLLVRAAVCASEHEADRAEELRRTRAWLNARPGDAAASPGLAAAVRSGRLSRGEAAGVAAAARRVRARRRAEVAAFLRQQLAVSRCYPGSGSEAEALARAWWDGVFDADDDPEPTISERGLTAAVATILGLAARLGGRDGEAAHRLLRARLASPGTGPEWRALKGAVVRAAIRDLTEGHGLARGSAADPADPGRQSPSEETG